MIYCLNGKIVKKSLDSVVISCAGVGYMVQMPASAAGALPGVGGEATIYTVMNVTENDVSLFGFATEEQQTCFKMLTGVSGVGPKVGLAILSVMTPDKVALAISSGDHKAFKAASGVGPKLAQRIGGKVELRLDGNAAAIIPGTPAGERDFDTEFLDYILAIKCVEGVQEAVTHIAAHSTGHSEAIVTNCEAAKAAFTAGVDSAAVYVNASTRFTDGGEFGLGCEMGISTQKLHARGPMGLEELCSCKYVIHGSGQIR